ncbi:hypothetical protein P3S67_028040 [Capsicum chacoense]
MKSKIRVLFESIISCGKPSKDLSEPKNHKDQQSIPTDEFGGNAQAQGHQDEQKHAQLVQGQMVKNEAKKEKEKVQGFFLRRIKITTYSRIIISSRQAGPPLRRQPPRRKTG